MVARWSFGQRCCRFAAALALAGLLRQPCRTILRPQSAAPPAAAQTASRRPHGSPGLPDFASLAEHYGPAVVNVAVVGKAQPVADFRRAGHVAERSVLRILPSLRPARCRAATIAAGARRRLGLHRQRRRLHPDQRARGRERRRSHGEDHRPARVHREGRRRRRAAPTSPCSRSTRRTCRRCSIGDPSQAAARRMGHRDRLAVRLREQRDRGHRQRHLALHARRATTRRSSRPTSR